MIQILAAIASATNAGLSGLATNSGPHGLTEIFFAFASRFGNNGKTFAGLSANSPIYCILTTIAMMAGRFGLTISALILAGLFPQQPARTRSRGTQPTDSLSFGILLTAFLILFTALSYLTILTLGQVLESLFFKI